MHSNRATPRVVRFDSLRSLGPYGAGLRWLTHSSLLDIYAVAIGFLRTFFSEALPVLIPPYPPRRRMDVNPSSAGHIPSIQPKVTETRTRVNPRSTGQRIFREYSPESPRQKCESASFASSRQSQGRTLGIEEVR
jgi:hypothetical protein